MKFSSFPSTFLVVATFQASPTSVTGFSSGAGGCAGGLPAVGPSHLVNAIQTSFDEAGLQFTAGGQVVVDTNTVLSSATDISFAVQVIDAMTSFKGALIRVEQGADSSVFSFVADSTSSEALACQLVPTAQGVTHSSSSDKTVLSGVFQTSSTVSDVTVDVTVVTSNNFMDGSVYSYQQFVFPVEESIESPVAPIPTDRPIPSPTDSPMSPPTESPVVAPSESPVPPPTDSPVLSPTQSPLPPPTDSPVSPPTDSPVVAPTESPVTASPPTGSPIVASIPTDSPVIAPTESPVSSAPTGSPIAASFATDSPVVAPIESPVTSPPTRSPVTNNPVAVPSTSPVVASTSDSPVLDPSGSPVVSLPVPSTPSMFLRDNLFAISYLAILIVFFGVILPRLQ